MKLKPNQVLMSQGCLHQVIDRVQSEISLNIKIYNSLDMRYKKNKTFAQYLIRRNERYEYILNFVKFLQRDSFDKRFLYLMFGSDLTSYTDTQRLTHEICNLVVQSKKRFPRKGKLK